MKQLKIYRRVLNDGTVWVATTFQKDPDYIKVIQKGDTPSCSLVTLSDALGAGWEEVTSKPVRGMRLFGGGLPEGDPLLKFAGSAESFVDGDLWESGEETERDFEVLEYIHRGLKLSRSAIFDKLYVVKDSREYTFDSEIPPSDFKDRTITKVKRLSDGVIFSVGELFTYTKGVCNYGSDEIHDFFLKDDRVLVRGVCGNNEWLSDITHPAPPKETPTQRANREYLKYMSEDLETPAHLEQRIKDLEQKLKEREDQLQWLIEQIDKIKTTKGNEDASIH